MEVEIKIDPKVTATKISVITNEVTPEITKIIEMLKQKPYKIASYDSENEIILLEPDEIYKFYAEDQNVFALLREKIVKVKHRLYELEILFSGTSFVRVSNSEIVNFDKAKSLDMSMTGTIGIHLDNGKKSYVSRRFMKKIKEHLKIK
ncbi:MAG: LytTR family DNA-binding domain-containing protein [Fusobacteriaceae bacterium]